MKNEIFELELVLIKTGNFVLLLNFLLFIYCLYIRKRLLKPIYFVYLLTSYLFILSIFELILLKFILVREFKYFDKVNDFLTSFGINTFDFISPPNYLLKFTILSVFFSSVFKNMKISKFYIYLLISLVFFELIMIFYFKNYQRYDSISSTVKNIFILSGGGILLYRIHKAEISNISLYKNTYFWIAFALFVTALSELFIEFIFTKLHESDLISFYKLYLVRNGIQVVFFIMLIFGFSQTKYIKYIPEKY